MTAEEDEMERVLRERLERLQAPEESREQILRASVEAFDQGVEEAEAEERQRRQRRRGGAATCFAVIALSGAAIAAAVHYADREGLALPLSEGPRAAVAESAVLARAPWLKQADGSPHILEVQELPSLAFPPRTSYAKAVRSLVRSVVSDGTLPDEVRLAAPLGAGVVWRSGTRKVRPRLDLRAPFGYSLPEGLVRTPVLRIDGSIPPAQARRITRALREGVPAGKGAARSVTLLIPRLRPCQRTTARAAERRIPACRIAPPKADAPARENAD
ncbi:hypothetical protein [Miltoncostaea oceani]|uniref:hypothetical protein n=1 Tax=Miltoncostaea oceani TaxID=2843216 RepID=UPI001C3C8D8B|nr:hypothetical protein [Miltoncostaea oceani]